MSADEFWKDDPQLFVSYRTSFLNKKKREMEEADYKCWLQGLYIYDGNNKINATLKQMLINMFSKSKDNREIPPYTTKPYLELQKEEQFKQTEKEHKLNDYNSSVVHFGTLKQQYTDRLKQKKGE